jgi:hypothetical protein
MTYREHEREFKPTTGAAYGVAVLGAIALIVGLGALTDPRPASALPAYAQQTHLSCGRCHVSPAGGGERNAFGKAFAANGHKLPSASKPGKTGAVDAPPPSSSGSGGGYYSSAVNPTYGFVPEFGYSNSLMFRIDH